MNVCFVGVGSIARRHIKNLIFVCKKRLIDLQIDAFRTQNTENIEGITNIYTNIKNIPNYYDVIFITNPTSLHLDTLELFHDKGKNFFIEKPVVSLDKIKIAKNFRLKKGVIYYVACPLRYNPVIQWIKQNINIDDVFSVRSICSSYLPEWRIGQDYTKSYSAHKDMGGGVSIDLIHEWDYITYLFGFPEKVSCFIGKKSNLEINSDDYAIYIAEYKNKIAELHLDYFGRKTIREICLLMKEDTITGDIANNQIKFLKAGKIIDFNEDRDDYQKRELNNFLDIILGHKNISHEYDFFHALKVLELTQGIIQNENFC